MRQTVHDTFQSVSLPINWRNKGNHHVILCQMALSYRHKEKWRLLEIQDLDSLQKCGSISNEKFVCQISFRSLTSSGPLTSKTSTSTVNLKCLHLKLSSDKPLQLVAVFCIHSIHSYPSQHTRSASL